MLKHSPEKYNNIDSNEEDRILQRNRKLETDNKDLNQQLDKVKIENNSLIKQINELRTRNRSKSPDLIRVENENKALKKKLEAASIEIKQLEERLNAEKSKYRAMSSEAAKNNQDHTLKREKLELKRQSEHFIKENLSLKDILDKERKKYESILKDMENGNFELKSANEKIQEKLTKSNEEILRNDLYCKMISDKNIKIQKELDELKTSNEIKSKKISDLEIRIEEEKKSYLNLKNLKGHNHVQNEKTPTKYQNNEINPKFENEYINICYSNPLLFEKNTKSPSKEQLIIEDNYKAPFVTPYLHEINFYKKENEELINLLKDAEMKIKTIQARSLSPQRRQFENIPVTSESKFEIENLKKENIKLIKITEEFMHMDHKNMKNLEITKQRLLKLESEYQKLIEENYENKSIINNLRIEKDAYKGEIHYIKKKLNIEEKSNYRNNLMSENILSSNRGKFTPNKDTFEMYAMINNSPAVAA